MVLRERSHGAGPWEEGTTKGTQCKEVKAVHNSCIWGLRGRKEEKQTKGGLIPQTSLLAKAKLTTKKPMNFKM